MKTFHIIRSAKILYLVLFLLLLGTAVYIGWMFFLLVREIQSGLDISGSSEPLIISLLCSSPFLLIAAWFWLCVRAIWQGRLIFEEQALVFESIRHFKFLVPFVLRPFTLAYDQIKTVRAGFMGMLEIEDIKGKKRTLLPAFFGRNYGEDVLVELRRHIPPESFVSGMEVSQIRQIWSRERKNAVLFSLVFLVIFLGTFFFDPRFSARPGLIDAWQVESRSLVGQNIQAYSPDRQGGLWVLAWRLTSYRVSHFSKGVDRTRKLPKDLLTGQFPELVSGDQDGNPIVWFSDGVYHYNGGEWQKIPFAGGLQLTELSGNGMVSGEQAWAIGVQDKNTVLLKIDALTGTWSPVPLPETGADEKMGPLFVRRAVDGDLLVLMHAESGSRVYILSGDQWQPQSYPVIASYPIEIRDYFLDGQQALWVLVNTGSYIVEKIDASGEIQLTQLPSPEQSRTSQQRYHSLLVDASGRLWVGGSYPFFMTVFQPVWDETSVELVRYTAANSNYQADSFTPPMLLPDGRIWAFDDRIATLDTRQPSLPAPLPDWFAAWDWNLIRMVVIVGLMLVYLVIYLVHARRSSPRPQKAAA